MVKYCLLAFLSGFSVFVSATVFADCHCPSWEEIIGDYKTIEVRHYRGGQTPHDEAVERIGENILISEVQFSLWGEAVYSDPFYEISCYPVSQEEGEVPLPSERRGDFYGFGMDRNIINVLYVTPTREDGPRYHFEVVGDELWFFFDGWFYRTRRISDS